MSRVLSQPADTAAVIATAGAEGYGSHAKMRMGLFFHTALLLAVLVDYVKAKNGTALNLSALVQKGATHQIAQGVRDASKEAFDRKNAASADLSTSAGSRVDAAHQSNTGLNLSGLGNARADTFASDLAQRLEEVHGSTRLLPQAVNLGPDKVVDALHWELLVAVASSRPVIKKDHLKAYATRAVALMTERIKQYESNGDAGLAAVSKHYLAFYEDYLKNDRTSFDVVTFTHEIDGLISKAAFNGVTLVRGHFVG